MIRLAWPWLLLALPLPLVMRGWLPPGEAARGAALRVPFLRELASPGDREARAPRRWPLWLAALAWLLAVLAAARPQWLGDPVTLPVSGRDIMLAVDLSESMRETDFRIGDQWANRLNATKWVADDFIARRAGDRVGLILFGEQAYLQTPLTFDRQTVRALLQEAQIGLAGRATAIGDAIGLGVKRLRDRPAGERVLILMTDGANTAGEVDPLQAAELAAAEGLTVYTIGIGAEEKLVRGLFGVQRVNPSTDLDEETLRQIAALTGGRYFRARDTAQLDQIYRLLDELEPIEQDPQTYRPVAALFYWPLAGALLLASAVFLLQARGAPRLMPAEFHFLRPLWLLALLPLTGALLAITRGRLGRQRWAGVVDAHLAPHVLTGGATRVSRLPAVLVATAGVLAIVALAGPAWKKLPQPVFADEGALVILLDLSRSMATEDIKPSRLERARFKVADLLGRRSEGQTALLVYAGDAFVVSPLTDDVATITAQMAALTPDLMPTQGSRADLALRGAQRLLQQAGSARGDVLLVTDGADRERVAPVVAELAAAGIRVSVLGVGTPAGGPVPGPDGFVKRADGSIVVARLERATLAELADAGNGLYQGLTADERDIERLTALLSANRATAAAERDLTADTWREEGPWLVVLLLPLAALAFRRGVLGLLAIAVVTPGLAGDAVAAGNWWQRPDQRAAQALAAGDAARAAELFDDPAWRAAARYRAGDYAGAAAALEAQDSIAAVYNRGNALARLGRFDAAIAAYEQVLEREPEHADARFNRDLLREQQQADDGSPQGQPDGDPSGEPQGQDAQQQQSGDGQQGAGDDRQHDGQAGGQADPQSGRDHAGQSPADPGGSQQAADDGATPDADEARAATPPPPDAADAGRDDGDAATTAANDTPDEGDLAVEQWLRRIPDDPGGLLRRKFEYQYRQRQQAPREEQEQW